MGTANRKACGQADTNAVNTSFMGGVVVRSEKRGASMGAPKMWGYSKPLCSFYALFHPTWCAVRYLERLGHFFLVSYHNSQVLVPFPNAGGHGRRDKADPGSAVMGRELQGLGV